MFWLPDRDGSVWVYILSFLMLVMTWVAALSVNDFISAFMQKYVRHRDKVFAKMVIAGYVILFGALLICLLYVYSPKSLSAHL